MGRYQAGDVSGAYESLFEPTGLDWRTAAEAAGPGARRPGHQGRGNVRRGRSCRIGRVGLGVEQAMIDAQCSRGVPLRRTRSNPATRAFLYELFPQREEVILEGGDHFSVTTDPRGRCRADRRIRLAPQCGRRAHLRLRP